MAIQRLWQIIEERKRKIYHLGMMVFLLRTNKKDLKKNLKLQGCPSDLKEKVEDMVTD